MCEDIFAHSVSFSLTCHFPHTRGISLFSEDDDLPAGYLNQPIKMTGGGVKLDICPHVKSGTSLSLQEQCDVNQINEWTNNEQDL